MKKDSQPTNVNDKLASHQVFAFEWDNMLRIIGVVTGITGIAAALLYLFGYTYVTSYLFSLGIRDEYYSVSIANERYLLAGFFPFLRFILNVTLLLIGYFIAKAITQTIIRDLIIRINRLYGFLIPLGLVLLIVLLKPGLDWDSVFSYSLTMILGFATVDIFLIGFETLVILGVKESKLPRYYNIATTTISIIKMMVLTWVIFMIFYNQAFPNGRLLRGCTYVTENPTPVVLYSVLPLGLEGESANADSYSYTGYYLLYTDTDNYYLFKELEPEVLRPKNIIIVKKSAVDVIQLENYPSSPNWNLTKTCYEVYGN
jgi:hypothetical protein